MVLHDEDIPAGIGVLTETQVVRADKPCLGPGEQPAETASVLAYRTYDAPEPFPERGAQRVIVTSALHPSKERAKADLECDAAGISSDSLNRLLQPEWHLVSYEDLNELEVGEDRKAVRYVAVNADGLVFLETYWATFRRGEVTAVLNVRAPLDNIGQEQFESLARKFDLRVQEGLRSLQ